MTAGVAPDEPEHGDPIAALRVDASEDDVVAACKAVALAQPSGALAALRVAARHPSARARRACIAAIVRLGDDAVLIEIAHALQRPDAAVVVGAARVLGDVGDARAVPNLIEALRTDDVTVFEAVADALARIGDPVCVPWLIAAADHGFAVDVACRALGALRDARAAPTLRRVRSSADRRLALIASEALVLLEEAG